MEFRINLFRMPSVHIGIEFGGKNERFLNLFDNNEQSIEWIVSRHRFYCRYNISSKNSIDMRQYL